MGLSKYFSSSNLREFAGNLLTPSRLSSWSERSFELAKNFFPSSVIVETDSQVLAYRVNSVEPLLSNVGLVGSCY